MTHFAKVEAVSLRPPKMPFRWERPLFSDQDGLGSTGSLCTMNGLALAFGFVDDDGTRSVGSGVMVAPGLLVTATHVAEATKGSAGMAYSFLPGDGMRLWAPQELSVLYGTIEDPLQPSGSRTRTSDVSLVSCCLMSDEQEQHPLIMATLEVAVPKLGERLWAMGYRAQESDDDTPALSMLCSSGLVTELHLDGRGNCFPGPQVEIAINTVGGMSGGPVFNADGLLVGIVSSSYEADDEKGPSFVSMIWPALVCDVTAPWPHGFWPDGQANLMKARDCGKARVFGDASFRSSEPNFSLRLPSTEEKSKPLASRKTFKK